MLDEHIAQKLIDRLAGTLNYNVNIMDETGTIIASHDHSRVGSFHETAYRMLKEGIQWVEVGSEEKLLGTKPGINMAIESKNGVVGVVGITGAPDTVRPYAHLLKAAIESLLEMELQQRSLIRYTSRQDRFFQQLIYREDRDRRDLITYAQLLKYPADCLRVPVYIQTESETYRETIAEQCFGNERNRKDDMITRTESGNTLMFLCISPGENLLSGMRDTIELHMSPIADYAARKKIPCRFLVGSLQKDLFSYRDAYLHCRWLKKNIKEEWGTTVYFYDHLYEFMQSRIPLTESKKAIGTIIDQYPDAFWQDSLQILEAMHRCHNNMVKASGELHMHKNTLVYRYNKLREALNINPLENAQDDLFARQLCYYLSHR